MDCETAVMPRMITATPEFHNDLRGAASKTSVYMCSKSRVYRPVRKPNLHGVRLRKLAAKPPDVVAEGKTPRSSGGVS